MKNKNFTISKNNILKLQKQYWLATKITAWLQKCIHSINVQMPGKAKGKFRGYPFFVLNNAALKRVQHISPAHFTQAFNFLQCTICCCVGATTPGLYDPALLLPSLNKVGKPSNINISRTWGIV